MATAIQIIICVASLLNLIFSIREGKDERWKQITNRPLNYAFSLLLIGYTTTVLLDQKYSFGLTTYKAVFDYIFCGVLVIYIVLLIIERKKFS